MAVRGQGKCLDLFPLDHWLTLEQKIKTTSFPDPETRKGIRRWMATMEELVMDNQGRVTLSQMLLDDTNIKTQAILYGALDHLELWGLDGWKDFLGDQNIISVEETIDRLEEVRKQANVEVALERNPKASPRDET